MKNALRFTLVFLVASFGSPLPAPADDPPPAGSPTERIPNTTTANAYPRWLGWTGINPGIPQSGSQSWSFVESYTARVAVDHRNVAHVVTATSDRNPNEESYFASDPSHIYYRNDSLQARRMNGLSAPVILANTYQSLFDPQAPDEYVKDPDIAVDALGQIHVVWQWYREGNGESEIYYCRKTSAGWGTPVSITPGYDDPFWVSTPKIKVDSNGVCHVVASLRHRPPYPDPTRATTRLIHISFLPGSSPQIVEVPGSAVDVPTFQLFDFPDPSISISPANVVHIVWTKVIHQLTWNSGWETQDQYREVYVSVGGGNGALLSDPSGFGEGVPDSRAADVAFDADGNAHYVWLHGLYPSWSVKYKQNGSGIQTIWGPGNGNVTHPRVETDSRRQVHAFWKVDAALYYAARVKNPVPDVVSPTWTLLAPAIPAPSRPPTDQDLDVQSVAISKDDTIHLTGRAFYTRTLEHGLGVRDAAAQVPVLPGGLFNTSNGNFHYALPIAKTSGVGPPMEFGLVHNALDSYPAGIDRGWRFTCDIHMIDHMINQNRPDVSAPDVADDTLTVFFGDGRPVRFQHKTYEEGNPLKSYYVAEDEFGYFGKIEPTTGGSSIGEFVLTTKQGWILWFNVIGRVRRIMDPRGNYTDIYYQLVMDDGNTTYRMSSVVDNLHLLGGGTPRVLDIEYDLSTDHLRYPRPIRINDPLGRLTELQYTGDRLTGVQFESVTGQPTHSFAYADADIPAAGERGGFIKSIRLPRGTVEGYGWTLKYVPDGRLKDVEDPPAVMLLEGDDHTSTPDEHTVFSELTYEEREPVSEPRKTWVKDRRQFLSKYVVEPRRSLALEIHNPEARAGTGSPIVRYFNAFGLVTDIFDRQGGQTTMVYHPPTEPTPHVRDNLKELWRPAPAGGTEKTASFTYTTDGYNNVHVATSYASAPDGGPTAARQTTYTYSGSQVESILYPPVTRPDGVVQDPVTTHFTYGGPRGQLSLLTDEKGNVSVFYGYASCGFHQFVTRPGGGDPGQVRYDSMGNLEQEKKPNGGGGNEPAGWTTLVRDGMDRVTSVTDPKGKVTTFAYDVDSNVVTTTPPAGGATTMTYDHRGLRSTTNTPDGAMPEWVDAAGNVRRSRGPRGFDTHAKYDMVGRVKQTKVQGASTVGGPSGGPAFHTTDFTYGVLTTTATQAGSRVTTTTHDIRMRPIQVDAPDGLTQTRTFYDEQDQVVATQVNHGGLVQTCSVAFRDARDRVHRTRTQDGPYLGVVISQLNRYTIYNEANAVVQEVDPLGSVTSPLLDHKVSYTRDSRQRVTQVIDGMGDVVQETVYGDDDLVTEVRVPDAQNKSSALVPAAFYTYTSRKEPKTALDRALKGTTTTYGDLPGQALAVTDALNRETRYAYHASTQRVSEIVQAFGTPDASSQLFTWQGGLLTETRVWDPTPGVNAYTALHRRVYDQADRLERLEAPLVSPEQYTYNDFGEVSRVTIGTKVVDHSYDLLGQRTTSTWSGSHNGQQVLTYNGLGQIQSIVDGNREIVRTYETWRGVPRDEIFKVGGATWKMQTHDFDLAGNYVGLLDTQNVQHAWPVNAANRRFENRYGGQVVSRTSFAPGGIPDRDTFFNAGGSPIATTTHAFDGLGRRVRALTVNTGTAKVLDDQSWTYDDAHQIVGRAANHLDATFNIANDSRGQLQSESTAGNGSGTTAPPFTNEFGGSSTGNISTRAGDAQVTPGAVQPVAARSASYNYGPGGNRMSATIDGVQRTYEYNAANQLVKETAAATNETIDYGYDTLGNQSTRIRKLGGVTQSTETFGYNHLNLMSSYTNSTGSVNYQYSFWPTGDRYAKTNLATSQSDIFVARGGDVVAEYQQLGAGSVTHKESYVQGTGMDQKVARVSAAGDRRHYVTNNVGTVTASLDDTGAIADSAVKDAWGTALSGSTAERFGGLAQREVESESGLTFVRHRMYDSRTGRFTQQDPILGNRPTEHYAYASNNPVSRMDPMGLDDHPKPKDVMAKAMMAFAGQVPGNPGWRLPHYLGTTFFELDAINVGNIALQKTLEGLLTAATTGGAVVTGKVVIPQLINILGKTLIAGTFEGAPQAVTEFAAGVASWGLSSLMTAGIAIPKGWTDAQRIALQKLWEGAEIPLGDLWVEDKLIEPNLEPLVKAWLDPNRQYGKRLGKDGYIQATYIGETKHEFCYRFFFTWTEETPFINGSQYDPEVTFKNQERGYGSVVVCVGKKNTAHEGEILRIINHQWSKDQETMMENLMPVPEMEK